MSQQQLASPRPRPTIGQRWGSFRLSQQQKKHKNSQHIDHRSNGPSKSKEILLSPTQRSRSRERPRERERPIRRNSIVRVDQAVSASFSQLDADYDADFDASPSTTRSMPFLRLQLSPEQPPKRSPGYNSKPIRSSPGLRKSPKTTKPVRTMRGLPMSPELRPALGNKSKSGRTLTSPLQRLSSLRCLLDNKNKKEQESFEHDPEAWSSKPSSMLSIKPALTPQQRQRPTLGIKFMSPSKLLSRSKNLEEQEPKPEYSDDERSIQSEEEVIRPRSLKRWSQDPHRKDVNLMRSSRIDMERELLKRNDRRGKQRSNLKTKLLDSVRLVGRKGRDQSTKTPAFEATDRESTSGRNSCGVGAPASFRGLMLDDDDDNDDFLGISVTSSVAPPHNLKDEELMLLLYRELQTMEQ